MSQTRTSWKMSQKKKKDKTRRLSSNKNFQSKKMRELIENLPDGNRGIKGWKNRNKQK